MVGAGIRVCVRGALDRGRSNVTKGQEVGRPHKEGIGTIRRGMRAGKWGIRSGAGTEISRAKAAEGH